MKKMMGSSSKDYASYNELIEEFIPEVSLTVLRMDWHKILKNVKMGRSYYITKRGKRVAVLIPAGEFR